MKEKDIQRLLAKHYAENTENRIEGVIELKLCKGKSIRWDSVKDHQIEALEKAESVFGLYHKISDSPVPKKGADKCRRCGLEPEEKQTRFTLRKPFDCFFVRDFPAWVVICWYVPRKKKTCHYIAIHNFSYQKHSALRKSFREDESKRMASHVLELKG